MSKPKTYFGLSAEERTRLKELERQSRELPAPTRSCGSVCVFRGGGARPPTALLAESVIGLFKSEVIGQRGPWRSLEDVEIATLVWVWWFNHHRLREPIGYVPPVEYEEAYFRRQEAQDLLSALT